jgi:predicted NAD/FAD-binding protein
LLAARLLAAENDIHVFEANNYAGGHTNIVAFEAFGKQYSADAGFMAFNDRTYPSFVKMLHALSETMEENRRHRGDLAMLVSFGSGYTWAGALLRRLDSGPGN